ncbi:MAG TPA: ATP-binding cassette domain-containing protein [bacterium]|nr:ATP-binding cassette domain-containing protein [bacterium]HPN32231.1 ATP-binding cassette domain-containing protein [bacterium]
MNVILKTVNLSKYFPLNSNFLNFSKKFTKAVDNVSIEVFQGETLALVGESGSGKTTLARCVTGLEKPNSGKTYFHSKDISELDSTGQKSLRKKMQIIFQDPFSSLNPRMKISDIITEGLIEHKLIKKSDKSETAKKLLTSVGLDSKYCSRFPHEFSGGQRQRISIARAISLNPELIICDEPVSALDMSVRTQILNLMLDLKKNLNLSYLFISHDMSVVYNIADRAAIMYGGKILEIGNVEKIFDNPVHPYTSMLISAIPKPEPESKKIKIDANENYFIPDKGCKFFPRCKYCFDRCKTDEPELEDLYPNHSAACHRAGKFFKKT